MHIFQLGHVLFLEVFPCRLILVLVELEQGESRFQQHIVHLGNSGNHLILISNEVCGLPARRGLQVPAGFDQVLDFFLHST